MRMNFLPKLLSLKLSQIWPFISCFQCCYSRLLLCIPTRFNYLLFWEHARFSSLWILTSTSSSCWSRLGICHGWTSQCDDTKQVYPYVLVLTGTTNTYEQALDLVGSSKGIERLAVSMAINSHKIITQVKPVPSDCRLRCWQYFLSEWISVRIFLSTKVRPRDKSDMSGRKRWSTYATCWRICQFVVIQLDGVRCMTAEG
jgi:hypothetical protein